MLAAAAPLAALLATLASNGLAPLAGLVALLLLAATLRDDPRSLISAPVALMVALLAWMALSATWALVPGDAVSTLYGLAPLLLGGGVIATVALRLPDDAATRLRAPLLAAYFLLLALIAVEIATGGGIARTLAAWRHHPIRLWQLSALSRPVVLAALLSWPCALLLWRGRHLGPMLLCLVAAVVIAWGGDHYSTRGALLLGVAAAAIVWLGGRWAAAAITAVLVLLVVTAPLLPLGPLSPRSSGALVEPIRNSGLHRLYIWEFAAHRIAEHPMSGWGLDSSRSMPGGDAPTPAGGQVMMMHPHNGPLQVWLELGVPGMLVLAGLLVLIGRGLFRINDRGARALASGLLVTAAVLACLSFGVWQTWWVGTLALTIGWTVAALRSFEGEAE